MWCTWMSRVKDSSAIDAPVNAFSMPPAVWRKPAAVGLMCGSHDCSDSALHCDHSVCRLLSACTCSGSERGGAKWREADLEWLGSKPTQVQTSMFEMGQEQPHAQEHDLPAVRLQGYGQQLLVTVCGCRNHAGCVLSHCVRNLHALALQASCLAQHTW